MMVIGSGAAKAGSRSTGFAGWKAVDQFVRQRLDARPQPLHLPRDEGAVDQRAQPRVDRRLELQHRVGLDRVEARQMRAVLADAAAVGDAGRVLPAEAAVAQQAVDVVEAAEAPEAELLPEEGAALAMQPGIGLIGVLEEPLLVRIEPQAAASRIEGEIGRWRHRCVMLDH